jgi:hypothetical protein
MRVMGRRGSESSEAWKAGNDRDAREIENNPLIALL